MFNSAIVYELAALKGLQSLYLFRLMIPYLNISKLRGFSGSLITCFQ